MHSGPEKANNNPNLLKHSPELFIVAGTAAVAGAAIVLIEIKEAVECIASAAHEAWASVEPVVMSPVGVAAGLAATVLVMRSSTKGGAPRWKQLAQRPFTVLKNTFTASSNNEK